MTLKYAQHQKGQEAEKHACEFLMKNGLKLIECNHRNKLGEIDLIMQDKSHVVFVEVRYRQQKSYGSSVESITPFKQAKIIKAASYYLQIHKLTEKVDCRFDVVGMTSQNTDFEIEWIKNAFSIEGI
jgi:putative endonuclease